MTETEKRLFLDGFVDCKLAVNELLDYCDHKFKKDYTKENFNEDKSMFWESCLEESKVIGAFNTLKKYFVQLQFPIVKGISKTDDYRNATLKGKPKQTQKTLELKKPNQITFEIYNSLLSGKIPVLIVPDYSDFNQILCAFSNKNEPKDFPVSMGACFINGINNWHKIEGLKKSYLNDNFSGNWAKHFKENVLPNPHLFKDKIIILSSKPYSAVNNKDFNLSEALWTDTSIRIRREHECAHMFTLQYYGHMANNIHDEIVADYAGIVKVLGTFNKNWLLKFMGLEEYPNYRWGGRLQNYQDPCELSDKAFKGLQVLVKRAVNNISEFDLMLEKVKSEEEYIHRIKTICEVDLITMSSKDGINALFEKYKSISNAITV